MVQFLAGEVSSTISGTLRSLYLSFCEQLPLSFHSSSLTWYSFTYKHVQTDLRAELIMIVEVHTLVLSHHLQVLICGCELEGDRFWCSWCVLYRGGEVFGALLPTISCQASDIGSDRWNLDSAVFTDGYAGHRSRQFIGDGGA